MWIKKIKRSLTLRIFWITVCLLTAACFLTYVFIALAMPVSYNGQITKEIEDRLGELANELEHQSLEDWGPMIDQFILQNETNITLFDENGQPVEIPGQSIHVIQTENRGTLVTTTLVEDVGILQEGSKSDITDPSKETASAYNISVAVADDALQEIGTAEYIRLKAKEILGKLGLGTITSVKFSQTVGSVSSSYPVIPYGEDKPYSLEAFTVCRPVNQAVEAMGRILPWLAAGILSVSILGALIYSHYITKPIVALNGISQKMAKLDFSWKCDETREDEIGELARSFNFLSEELSTALEQLQQANKTLKEDIDREREMEQQRTMFFSAVSHELKTPITIIKGQLEGMIGNVGVYRDRDKYLARSLETTNRMEDMVQEILTVSRMKSEFTLQKMQIDFTELVERQTEHFRDLAEQKGISLELHLEPGLIVSGDASLLKRVADNLLSNALIYSEEGEKVFVAVRKKGEKVFLMVENTGTSIPEDCLPHLFEAFYRVEKSRNRRTGGSGLGLYLVKMILDKHEARCMVENTAGGVLVSAVLPVS